MYSYTWDAETGGLLLNSSPLSFSKEPRPVYYKELDILGFNRYWNYAKNDSYPYMWAEANNYFYRGRQVAKTKGGSLYTAPEIVILDDPEPNGQPLRFVDIPAMIEKNRDLLEKLASETIKKIYNTYVDYMDRVDVFYVAFSGGKDSVVALDLVQRALPHNKFKVLFGDTGMEFPDTYTTVDRIEAQCKEQGIEFVRAKSHFSPEESWRKFGPPATVTRWCCSVHKTAPQVIALRELTGKSNFTGMAFIGVRASESISRSEYDYISLGEKHKGQYSCNPILEWNSAELYMYIYSEDIYLSEAYKKGNRRAGCLVCPRAAERNDYMARVWYTKEFDSLVNTIKNMYAKSFPSDDSLNEFIANGGWKARKNGRDIDVQLNYSESSEKEYGIIRVNKAKTPWREWIKTIGVLLNDENPYRILFRNEQYTFEVIESGNNLEVKYDIANLAYTPQVNWAVKRLHINEAYGKDYALSLLVADGAKESWVKDIWSSFSRLADLPLGTVGFGYPSKEKGRMVAITRMSWQNPNPLVILYSLYKFAEACGDYHQFTLSRLLNHDIESDGVSPTEIFGLDRNQMEKILNGLTINYPDFINASFTLDLDNITLNSEKTSQDVLSLF